MAHLEIFSFCLFYFLSFTIILSVTPYGSFPPVPFDLDFEGIAIGDYIGIGAFDITVEWYQVMSLLVIVSLSTIVAINVIPKSIMVLGSGVDIDLNKYQISTAIIGFAISGAFSITLMGMMPEDMPPQFTFLLIVPFAILMVYSVVSSTKSD